METQDINDRELTKAVVCLAHGEGGVLLLGVDNDGTVVGAKPRHDTTTEPHRVAALIQNTIEPALAVAVALGVIDGRDIVRIDVPRADPGPIAPKMVYLPSESSRSTAGRNVYRRSPARVVGNGPAVLSRRWRSWDGRAGGSRGR